MTDIVTVQNDTIKVTVTRETWDSYQESARAYSNGEEGAEMVQRGFVLSDAMAKLGNASELKFLENEPPTPAEIKDRARKILIFRYLEEHCRYDWVKVVMRMESGAHISQGMAADIAEARAYASGILDPISNDQLMDRIIALGKAPHSRDIKKVRLQRNFEGITSDEVLATALQSLEEELNIEKNYRTTKANMDGWDIEVIGPLPAQIGLCRMGEQQQ